MYIDKGTSLSHETKFFFWGGGLGLPLSQLLFCLALFAAILSTALFLSLISKASSWNNNPQFGIFDRKFIVTKILNI